MLGITAALLWSAQGAIMMSYPLEKDKGKSFGIFWAIFQFGAFIGSVIALAINIRSGKLTAVTTSTYIVRIRVLCLTIVLRLFSLQAFLIIIFLGIASAFLVLPPNRVIRSDGTLVKLQAFSSFQDELHGFVERFKDWRMLGMLWSLIFSLQHFHVLAALAPMFFASNYFYAYQGAINAAKFDGPTRALNATLEGAGAIVGALMIGFLVLDGKRFSRRTRGFIGLGIVTSITTIVWACALHWQLSFDRLHINGIINYKESRYAAKGTLYFFCAYYLYYCAVDFFAEINFISV
jgi:Ion channel regulatory protein UNC-93